MTGFSALNTAITGLFAAQRSMDVAGQNITNSNTEGYSRQRAEMSSLGATAAATFHTASTNSVIGGVHVDGVFRIRDTFLEAARADAGSRLSALTTRASVLTGAEQLLAEPGDTGLQKVMDDFFNSWHDLAKNPTESSAGAVVLQSGEAAADQVRSLALSVSEHWTSALEDLRNVVTQTNQASSDLASLNETIREGVNIGNPVNELMDQRDKLARKLGELVGATARQTSDGGVDVTVNGVSIVTGKVSQTLTVAGADDITLAAGDPPHLMWQSTSVPVVSGQAGGLLTGLGSDLPNLLSDIDGVAVSLRDAVNSVHAAGFRLDGTAGGDFFAGTSALNLSVVPTSSTEIAVSATAGDVDNSIALKIGDLADDRKATAVLGGPGPLERWRGVAATVGTTVQSLERSVAVQQSVVATADDAVESDAGVNVDEEMTSMLLFQRAYQASARVVTTVDEMLDTLINRTGTVGR